MLLEWAAIALAQDPQIEVHTLIAIPYNPYHPKQVRAVDNERHA